MSDISALNLIAVLVKLKALLKKLRSWRLQNLSQRNFMLILSILVGLTTGLIAVAIKNGAQYIREVLALVQEGRAYLNILYVFYPLVGIVLTVLVVKRIFKKELEPGVPAVLFAISKRKSRLKRHNIYTSFFTSILTVGFGGSAGLEAPTVQTAAAVASNLSSGFKLNYQQKTLLVGCAAAASLAAIFKAPVAAIVFAIEVIMLDLTTASLVPLLLASISASVVSRLMLGESVLLNWKLTDNFDLSQLHFYILLAVAAGLAALGFTRFYLKLQTRLNAIKNYWAKAILGGVIIGVILLLFPALYGEGYDVLNSFLSNNLRAVVSDSVFENWTTGEYAMLAFMACLVLLKGLATGLTIGAGGVGGIFAPSLFMGGTLGFLFSRVFYYFGWADLSSSNFTLVGMCGVMAGVLHAPLTAMFLIAEITGGYELFIPLMLTSAIAYYTVRSFSPYSIYTYELGRKGHLITHDKDQAVLTLMNLKDEIETNFLSISTGSKLRHICEVVSKSQRNLFPVLDEQNQLVGIVTLDEIREIMFDQSQYDEVDVESLMTAPPELIQLNDNMDTVMEKFETSGAWNLPVLDGGTYKGFVSKSRLYSAYRKHLVDFTKAENG